MARTQKELTEIKVMFFSKPLTEIEAWLKRQSSIGELQIVVDGWLRGETNPANLMKLDAIKKKLFDISGSQIRPAAHSGKSDNKPLLGPGEWKQHNKN
jgi:hypothetical protein